ncbi:NmrA family NAD(P)-binding protein [Actinocatenispora thailandica]
MRHATVPGELHSRRSHRLPAPRVAVGTVRRGSAVTAVAFFGATGYAGGHLTKELLAPGHHVVAVARDVSGIELRPALAGPGRRGRLAVRRGVPGPDRRRRRRAGDRRARQQ